MHSLPIQNTTMSQHVCTHRVCAVPIIIIIIISSSSSSIIIMTTIIISVIISVYIYIYIHIYIYIYTDIRVPESQNHCGLEPLHALVQSCRGLGSAILDPHSGHHPQRVLCWFALVSGGLASAVGKPTTEEDRSHPGSRP